MIKLNGLEVDFTKFPNSETKIEHDKLHVPVGFKKFVEFKYEDDSDLIKLLLLKEHLDDLKINVDTLFIYYMPYSRMDRVENGSPFTLKSISKFINSMNFNKIVVVEPHSDVTNALLNNVEPIYINYYLVNEVKDIVNFDDEMDYIVFPDLGASKRYNKMKAKNVLVGHKNRNFETGEITKLDIIGKNTGGKKAIIVDDLSSYGGTFVKTAIELSNYGVEEIYLLVAHAENSIFKGQLFEYVDKVFTTDSILTEQENWENQKFKNQLHIFNIGEWL